MLSSHIKFSDAARCLAILLLLSLTACSIKPYRIDIQQGNVITPEQFAQLKEGMTRDQVKFVLGSPMLSDVFHDKRWDYHYRMENGKTGEVTAYGLSIHFNAGGKVEKIVADEGLRSLKPDEAGGNRVYDLSGPAKS